MNDKERLEEIKLKFNNTIDAMLYVPYEDVKFLIEQAERVQELEEFKRNAERMYKYYHISAKKSVEEKERYKQALEFYADPENYCVTFEDDYEPILKDNGKIAREALKGETK